MTPRHRRGRLEVLAAVVKACPRSPTRLMLEANVSFAQLGRCTNHLIQAGLLRVVYNKKGFRTYLPTPTGRRFVSYLERARSMLNGHPTVED